MRDKISRGVPAPHRNGSPAYRAYSLHNFRQIPAIARLNKSQIEAISVVGHVLPFRVNNYVIEKLIDWDNVPDDPVFRLTFPQREMLQPVHFDRMSRVLARHGSTRQVQEVANAIRRELNPHPAGQMELNVPVIAGHRLSGIQHKYRETVLCFPCEGQTCHAFCTFCFRWPQFVGIDRWKIATKEKERLVAYLRQHPEVSDVIFTGGDPMIMRSAVLAGYIDALLEADLPHLKVIRIGSKALSYWPYKFTTDREADQTLALFERVVRAGKHLAFMAHFSHPAELSTPEVGRAIRRIRATGAVIRTQAPLLRHINDRPEDWREMWREQVRLGCVPYYMFVVRDTGAQHYFSVPLVSAWRIFKAAYQGVSGIARTVRGPSMSCTPGKIQVLGTCHVDGQKVIALQMLQGRKPDWVNRPFFAEYDEAATWIDELTPAFGEGQFFFEKPMPARKVRTSGTRQSVWTR